MMSFVVSGSRLPVGSSARISAGSLSNALATATLCCSPPESWCGIDLRLCGRPTCIRTSSILLEMAVLSFHPVASKTNERLSSTLRSYKS